MQETPQLETPAVPVYASAVNEAAQLKEQGNQDLQTRNVSGLLNVASKLGANTDAGRALVSTAKDIQDRGFQFKAITAPIENARTDGERNLAAANALRNVSQQPLYGQALIAFMMGQKDKAFNLATGGEIKTEIQYARDNGSIIEVRTNALGQPQSYFDRGLGRLLTPEEHSQRLGSTTDFDRTLAAKNIEQNRAKYNEEFSKEKIANRALFTTFNTIKIDPIQQLANELKFGLPADVYAKMIGIGTTALGQSSNRSDASQQLNQIIEGAGKSEGTTVTAEVAARLGLGREFANKQLGIDGKYLVVKGTNIRENIDNLKQRTSSTTVANETTKNISSNLENLLTEKSFQSAIAGMDPKKQAETVQKMRAFVFLLNEAGGAVSQVVDKYGKPDFISLPTAVSFADPQSQFMLQLEALRHNKDMINAYVPFFEDAAKAYDDTKTLPIPKQIQAAFVTRPIRGEIAENTAKRMQQIVETDYQNRLAKQAQPAARTSTQPAKAEPVVPPKASLPKGVPEGSTAIGWSPEGQRVYKAPNGKMYTGAK
jgi:hypothetical protein